MKTLYLITAVLCLSVGITNICYELYWLGAALLVCGTGQLLLYRNALRKPAAGKSRKRK